MKHFEEVIGESKPTLAVFMHAAEHNAVDLKYLVAELQKQYGDKANIARVDTSFNRKMIEKFRLNTYPTWILFKEGQELMRESGNKTVTQLGELIERAL